MAVMLALENVHGYRVLGPLGRRNWGTSLVKDHGYKEIEHDLPLEIHCI